MNRTIHYRLLDDNAPEAGYWSLDPDVVALEGDAIAVYDSAGRLVWEGVHGGSFGFRVEPDGSIVSWDVVVSQDDDGSDEDDGTAKKCVLTPYTPGASAECDLGRACRPSPHRRRWQTRSASRSAPSCG